MDIAGTAALVQPWSSLDQLGPVVLLVKVGYRGLSRITAAGGPSL